MVRTPVMLAECNRKEIRQALERGDLQAAIIPIGATEQHNEHLALGLDIHMSTYVAQQVALALHPRVIVAPGCPVGFSPYHMARRGTLTLRKETLRAYLYDVMESLRTHGIRTILVVNGHGGNHGLLAEQLPGWRRALTATLDEASYWTGMSDTQRAEILQGYRDLQEGSLRTVAEQTALNHASEEETSVMMVAHPDGVQPCTMAQYDAENLDYATDLVEDVRQYLQPFAGSGWPEGGPNPENPRDRARQENALLASAEKGRALLDFHTRWLVDKLEGMMAEG
jgi:creatinine amidohydrolase/Fe(II)-dependent formamide hydrolase-like protein